MRFGGSSAQLFLDAGRLAAAVTQVVQLRTADITAALDFDLGDQRAVQGERTLNTFAVGDLANDEAAVEATVATCNDNAFVACIRLRVPSITFTLTITVSPGANAGISLFKRAISSCSRVWIRFMVSTVDHAHATQGACTEFVRSSLLGG